MGLVGNIIVRLVVIGWGLCVAFLSAGLFIGIGYYTDVMAPIGPETDRAVRGLASLLVGLFWSPYVAAAAFAPAAVIILLAEGFRVRSLTANVALGALVALLAFWLHRDFSTAATRSTGPLVVVLSMGFIGGAAYWLIAGRSAGRWLEVPQRRPK
jgi:hypothetical protein